MHVRMRTADRRVSPWQQHDYSREPGKAKLEDTKTISAAFMLGFAVMNVSDLYTSAGQAPLRATPDAACANCRSLQLLEHAQIPPALCCGPWGRAIPSPVTVDALHQVGGPTWSCRCLGSSSALRQPQALLPPTRSPVLNDSAASSTTFWLATRLQVKSTCSTSSVLAALRLVPRRFLTSTP